MHIYTECSLTKRAQLITNLAASFGRATAFDSTFDRCGGDWIRLWKAFNRKSMSVYPHASHAEKLDFLSIFQSNRWHNGRWRRCSCIRKYHSIVHSSRLSISIDAEKKASITLLRSFGIFHAMFDSFHSDDFSKKKTTKLSRMTCLSCWNQIDKMPVESLLRIHVNLACVNGSSVSHSHAHTFADVRASR